MFEKLINLRQCPPGHQVFVCHAGHELAVFHLTKPDRFIVSQNTCPHAGGNLAAGEVQGTVVICPLHHWQFDLTTGHCRGTIDVFLKRFACKVKGDELLVDLSNPLPVPPPPRYDF